MTKLYVICGKAGDLLSQLPILYRDFQQTGLKPKALVANEFSKVLDGCSYIEPIIFDGSYLDLEGAVKLAHSLSDDVIVTSIHGTKEALAKHTYSQAYSTGAVTSNFQLEQWNLAGRAAEFYDNLPLVFDRRSPDREKRLLDTNGILKMRKPLILLALGGRTAGFAHAELLRDYVHAKFDKSHRVIDLPMTEDGHCYDLLAIYERAALLITTDSMPLHLAWACRSLPVFALTNDRDSKGNHSLWHGSPWRPNHLWYCRYSDWPARAVEMMQAVEDVVNPKPKLTKDKEEFLDLVMGTYVFRQQEYWRGSPTSKHSIRVSAGMCSREFHGAPFLKDVVRMGMQRTDDDEHLIHLFRPEAQGCFCFPFNGPVFAYRLHKGTHIPIADLFSAPKSFWKTILPEVPDLLLDNEDAFWSEALCAIFRKHGAKDVSGVCEFAGKESK